MDATILLEALYLLAEVPVIMSVQHCLSGMVAETLEKLDAGQRAQLKAFLLWKTNGTLGGTGLLYYD